MNCPKCDFEIDEKMLVCPNCKKVLKLVCPKCNTINTSNTCKKCGFSIIAKCHQCGKINQTIKGKCSKCGFSTYSSVAINSSNIDEFACITIDFPNLQDIKSALGSTKLFEKFKVNLDALITNYVREHELSREIIDESYVIRFNKDLSFPDSANNAVNSAIEILNQITELNFKLNEFKNILLQCNIAILKRDINSLPEDYKSGFDIKMIYNDKEQSKLLSGLQVIAESKIYEVVCDNFELSTLSSTLVKKQMVMFFELNIKKYVKIPKKQPQKEEFTGLPSLPTFTDEDDSQEQSSLYDVDGINFDELRFNFINTESIYVIDKVIEKLQLNPLNVISIRARQGLAPRTEDLLSQVEKLHKFKNIFRVTCHDGLKYEPYGFFRELISCICNFAKAPRNYALNSFEMFKDIDSSNFIYNLINSKQRAETVPESSRYTLFNIFFNIFSSIHDSLIYIEDFDKMDDSSYEIIQMFFEKLDEFNVSYITVSNKDFSLHRNAHFLLSSSAYTEIIANPTPIKDILEKNLDRYKDIVDSFYMRKIAQHFKGSYLYLQHIVDYLVDNDAISREKDKKLSLTGQQGIFIPTNIDELVAKQMFLLAKEENAYKLLMMMLFVGPRVDIGTIQLFEIPEVANELQKLMSKKIIYKVENSFFVNNYNLYFSNFVSTMNFSYRQQIARELLDKVFSPEHPTSVDPILYNILSDKQEEFTAWLKLGELSNSLGDFNAYLHCSDKFLKLADHDTENKEKNYKKEVFKNISNLMNKSSPEKLKGLLQEILDNFEQDIDNQKIIELCNKMLQGYLLNGDYRQALDAIRKISANVPNMSINPYDENFNAAFFFINLVKVEILFSIGSFKDCIETANEVLDVINPETINQIRPEYLTQDKFESLLFDAMSFAVFSKVLLLDFDVNEFLGIIKSKIGYLPQNFELFLYLQDVIWGTHIESLPKIDNPDEDRFSNVLINIISAFNFNKEDYNSFASDIHQAKVSAKAARLLQLELFCDLLIGYSYFKLNRIKKAYSICNNVLETSEKKGLNTIVQISWYLISIFKYNEGNSEVASAIVNNAIVQLEKDENSSDLLFFLFKFSLAKMFFERKEYDSARICWENAELTKEKYGLNFDTYLDFDGIPVEVQAPNDFNKEPFNVESEENTYNENINPENEQVNAQVESESQE